MSPQFLLRSIAVLVLGAGGVNLAHAVSPDAGILGTPEDQTAQLAEADVSAPVDHTATARGDVARPEPGRGDAGRLDQGKAGPVPEGVDRGAQAQGEQAEGGRRIPADSFGQGGGRGGEVVHADLDRRPQDKPKIRKQATAPSRKGPSSAGYVSRLAAAPSNRADILCNDLDYLKRRLQRKGVEMSGIQVELHRHHDRARKARFIMARSSSQATLRAFAAEVGDLRAKKVRLPLVADPGELESAGLYRRCSCVNGKAKCP